MSQPITHAMYYCWLGEHADAYQVVAPILSFAESVINEMCVAATAYNSTGADVGFMVVAQVGLTPGAKIMRSLCDMTAPPVPVGGPTPSAAAGASSFPWLGVLLGVGVVGGAIALLAASAARHNHAGWYVLNYSAPLRDPSRRLKGVRGPFENRQRAVEYAQTQRWIDTPGGRFPLWVPKVEYRQGPPA